MIKIIVRNPFIGKESKKEGIAYFNAAINYQNDRDLALKYLIAAAPKLGFLSVEDMIEYYDKHKKF